jgi:hypothetical protein
MNASSPVRIFWRLLLALSLVGIPCCGFGVWYGDFRLVMPWTPDELPGLRFWYRFWIVFLVLSVGAAIAAAIALRRISNEIRQA